MTLKVGVVVVSYNSQAVLQTCLNAWRRQTVESSLLLVDNASQDSSVSLAQNEGIEVLQMGWNSGFAKATNCGAEVLFSRGCTHVLCLNPDTQMDPECIEKLLATAKKTKASLVQSSIYCRDNKKINTLGNVLHYSGISYCPDFGKEKKEEQEDHHISMASGACMLMSRECFFQLGGMRDDFFLYMEDTDFSWRCLLSGGLIVLSTKAICYHEYILKIPPWKLALLDRNRLMMVLTNYSFKTLLIFFPVLFFVELLLLVWSIMRGYFFLKIKGYVYILKSLHKISLLRKNMKQVRKMSDKKMLEHMISKLDIPGLTILGSRILNGIFSVYLRLVKPLL